MSGYKVILTEGGKQYGGTYSKVLGSDNAKIREDLIKNQINKIKKFANSQTELQKKIESILAKNNLTLTEFLQQRSGFNSNDSDGDKIMLFQDKFRKYSKNKENKIKEMLVNKDNLEKSSQKYYNAIHKIIDIITSTIELDKNTTPEQIKSALLNAKSKIDLLDTYEQELYNNYEAIFTNQDSFDIMSQELIKEWNAVRKHSSKNATIKSDGQINISPLNEKQQEEIDDLITTLAKESYERKKRGGKTAISFLYSNSDKTEAGRLKKYFSQVENKLKERLKQTKGEEYTQQELQDAAHRYLLETVKRAVYGLDDFNNKTYSLNDLQPYLHHSSETDAAKDRAKVGEISHTGLSQKAIQTEIKDFAVECIQSGGSKTRIIKNRSTLTNFETNHKGNKKYRDEDYNELLKIQNALIDKEKVAKKDVARLQKELNKNKFYNVKLTPEEDKIDNYIKLTNTKTQEKFFIAFSDKLYNSFSYESNISSVGIATGTNLLSSLDLFAGPEFNLEGKQMVNTNNLLFAMLNQAKASIYYNETNREEIKNFIEDMLSTYYISLAFNANNFINIAEGATDSNVLYISNIGNAYVPSNVMIKGIIQQLNSKSITETVVNAIVDFDDSHTAKGLWDASLRIYTGEKEAEDARWNYVANQVAANTSINVTTNLIALNNLFSNTMF